MRKLLHIIASPRGEKSRTLTLSKVFIEKFHSVYPQAIIDELNVFEEDLPEMVADSVDGKYVLMGGRKMPDELKASWQKIEAHINRFMAADAYLVSTPMWNFSIPYKLKHYIDVVWQPRYLFQMTSGGYEGYLNGRKLIIITTHGGDYSEETGISNMNFLEPYLKSVFSFAGLLDSEVITAEPMDAGGEGTLRKKINDAIQKIHELEI